MCIRDRLAKGRYQTKISSVGDYNGDGEVNATDIAEYIRDVRHSQGYDGMIPWDINFYVQAALSLDSYYPGEGYDQDAIAMADVIYKDMTGDPGYFIHPVDQWFYYYVLGLSGALQAFTSTGTHLTGSFSAEEIKNFLVENQSNDGSWNSTSYWDGTNWYWVYPDVQSTAYAIMALISYGDSASISAATKAADWLISKQNPNGGWTVSSECPEVDSEAAQAIFDVIQAIGTVDVDHGSDGTIDLKTITIQQAINAAYPNDTIIVHEGTYNEALIVDKEGLNILGLGNVILDGTGIDVDYGIHVVADNVIIKNFHIANFTYGWGWGVQLTGADHCLLENLLVEKCNSGINLYRGSDHNIIQNCEINGIGGHGISIYGSDLGCTHNIIRNNRMIGCAWYMPYGKYHLAVMPIFSNVSYNVIEGNILTGTGVGYGMCLWGYTYGRADMPEVGNLIRANNISNFDTAVYIRGRNPETGTLNLVTNTSILENNIKDNRIGVYVEGFDSNVIGLLHYNNIEGNTEYGALFNATYGTAILDARFNWWGDPTGPYHNTTWTYKGEPYGPNYGLGDRVSDYALYYPWLDYPWPLPRPLLKVEPLAYHAKYLNETFDVNITVNNLSSSLKLVGFEFKLRYNTTLLEVVEVINGTFLESFASPPNGGTLYFGPIIRDDYIQFAGMILPDENGTWHEPFPSGNGTIATITFKVIYQPIGLENPVLLCNLTLFDTKLGDLEANVILHEVEHGHYDIVPTPMGDLNFDGITDIYDALIFATAFGGHPSHPRWNPYADLNQDKIIDIFDAIIMGSHFGEERSDP